MKQPLKALLLGTGLALLLGVPQSHAADYEHLILYGQSLSTGQQSWPPLSTKALDGNFMIGTQVWSNYNNPATDKLMPLLADVAAIDTNKPKTRASQTTAECPIVATANHLQMKAPGRFHFIATSCGTGGQTIEQLSKEHFSPARYRDFSNALDYASKISASMHCPAVFWMQGEYNYGPGSNGLTRGAPSVTDKSGYKELLLKLKDNMQADIMEKYHQPDKPLFITYQVGAGYTRGSEVAIGMAQLEASNENPDVICAGPVYPVTNRGGHRDPNGYRWYGEMLGKVYYKTKVLGETFKPLQPLQISRGSSPNTLAIKFLVPQPPLVLDDKLVPPTNSSGFAVLNDGVKIEIKSVTVSGNDTVELACASELNGVVEVTYAGSEVRGQGNLRDSDAYAAFYNYLDLDAKDSQGHFIYERDPAEPTLRPAYEPRDDSGVIYDKPYPLYNFCVAFYYKLGKGDSSYSVPGLEAALK